MDRNFLSNIVLELLGGGKTDLGILTIKDLRNLLESWSLGLNVDWKTLDGAAVLCGPYKNLQK